MAPPVDGRNGSVPNPVARISTNSTLFWPAARRKPRRPLRPIDCGCQHDRSCPVPLLLMVNIRSKRCELHFHRLTDLLASVAVRVARVFVCNSHGTWKVI